MGIRKVVVHVGTSENEFGLLVVSEGVLLEDEGGHIETLCYHECFKVQVVEASNVREMVGETEIYMQDYCEEMACIVPELWSKEKRIPTLTAPWPGEGCDCHHRHNTNPARSSP